MTDQEKIENLRAALGAVLWMARTIELRDKAQNDEWKQRIAKAHDVWSESDANIHATQQVAVTNRSSSGNSKR